MSDTSPIDLNFLATECTDLRQFDTKLSYLDGKGVRWSREIWITFESSLEWVESLAVVETAA